MWLAHRGANGRKLRHHFLAAGVAGGFGSVFGTPIAGTLFGLEFVVLGRLDYTALLPALIASLVGDMVTRGLGVEHTVFPVAPPTQSVAARIGQMARFCRSGGSNRHRVY